MYNVTLPDDHKDWSPAKAKLYNDKIVADVSTTKAIEAELAAYPEIAKILYADPAYLDAEPQVKRDCEKDK